MSKPSLRRNAKVHSTNHKVSCTVNLQDRRQNRPDHAMFDSEFGVDSEPYEALGNAIIKRAYQDYVLLDFCSYRSVRTKDGEVSSITPNVHDPISKNEIKLFLDSDLYSAITDVPGEALIKLAEHEIEIIKKAFEDGIDYKSFLAMNHGELFNVNKNDYNKYKRNYRETSAVLARIKIFEQRDGLNGKKWGETSQYYRILTGNKLENNPEPNPHAIYILTTDHLSFWKYDEVRGDYYRIFGKSIAKYRTVWLSSM